MANSTGSDAKRSSRLCFTFVKVTTPTAPRTPLPTKFAVAEKHTARFLRCENYTYHRGTQKVSHDAVIWVTRSATPELEPCHRVTQRALGPRSWPGTTLPSACATS